MILRCDESPLPLFIMKPVPLCPTMCSHGDDPSLGAKGPTFQPQLSL